MRVLITGVTGFVGSHLADYLVARGDVEVYGIHRWRSRMDNVEHLRGRIELVECDLRDAAAARRMMATLRPDRIFHLAAQSYVPTSWLAPAETLTGNVIAQLNLFEAVREERFATQFHIAGSSEEYGFVRPDEIPIREENPLRPLSPYAVSKVAQDYLAYQYWMSYGLHAVRTRGFNHTGPRRGEVFVTSNFARQIAEIEKGLREPIVWVGNLEAIRDFTDVRDMVQAYWLALERGEPGEVYNICSGRGYAVRNVLDILLDVAHVKVEVREDPTRLRPSDVEVLLGDCTRFRRISGWEPTIPFEVTLKDLLEYWRQRV
ncbi:MAG TPA: GDP-mannose 4,6-dehydratase [Methylomirabilota bacterium]|jgi:GDP-4-dehydro-6-deoxy-D-mannose reductase|nr:GDP-mannose 4,6-dehydratase [Methylomirabilota bacterium]